MESKTCVCSFCNESFASKTKLFKHLELKHNYDNPNSKPDRIILLVGWLSDYIEDNDSWVGNDNDDTNAEGHKMNIEIDKVEDCLYRAIYCMENNLDSISLIPSDIIIERPKGSSRASSVVQRSSLLLATEHSCHSLCDTFLIPIKRFHISDIEWLSRINEILPNTIRVLHKYILGAACTSFEFHAEVSCTQRRYEYMLPYKLLNPISKPNHILTSTTTNNDNNTNTSITTALLSDDKLIKRSKTYYVNDIILNSTRNSKYSMQQEFPIESDEGQSRVLFFRKLKNVLKLISGIYTIKLDVMVIKYYHIHDIYNK